MVALWKGSAPHPVFFLTTTSTFDPGPPDDKSPRRVPSCRPSIGVPPTETMTSPGSTATCVRPTEGWFLAGGEEGGSVTRSRTSMTLRR